MAAYVVDCKVTNPRATTPTKSSPRCDCQHGGRYPSAGEHTRLEGTWNPTGSSFWKFTLEKGRSYDFAEYLLRAPRAKAPRT
jgi:hypothetical protein